MKYYIFVIIILKNRAHFGCSAPGIFNHRDVIRVLIFSGYAGTIFVSGKIIFSLLENEFPPA